MIRHGLVHQSPGYVCPFCPDREHKYPRPDNLQRYVFFGPPKTVAYRHSLTDHQQTCPRTSRGQGQGRPPAPRRPRAAARRRQSRAEKTSKPTSPSPSTNSNTTRFLLANDPRSLPTSHTTSCIKILHQTLLHYFCFQPRVRFSERDFIRLHGRADGGGVGWRTGAAASTGPGCATGIHRLGPGGLCELWNQLGRCLLAFCDVSFTTFTPVLCALAVGDSRGFV